MEIEIEIEMKDALRCQRYNGYVDTQCKTEINCGGPHCWTNMSEPAHSLTSRRSKLVWSDVILMDIFWFQVSTVSSHRDFLSRHCFGEHVQPCWYRQSSPAKGIVPPPAKGGHEREATKHSSPAVSWRRENNLAVLVHLHGKKA